MSALKSRVHSSVIKISHEKPIRIIFTSDLHFGAAASRHERAGSRARARPARSGWTYLWRERSCGRFPCLKPGLNGGSVILGADPVLE